MQFRGQVIKEKGSRTDTYSCVTCGKNYQEEIPYICVCSTQKSPKPRLRYKDQYNEHFYLKGISIHSFDPMLSERFTRYSITFPDGSIHEVDLLGSNGPIHLHQLTNIIDNEMKLILKK